MKKLEKIVPTLRLSFAKPKSKSSSVFGPGIAALCLGVRNFGSLNAAAKSMGMAYSKAWRITKDTEEALGFKLLHRDGAHGSELTDEASKLLDLYTSMQEKLSKESMKLYQKAIQ